MISQDVAFVNQVVLDHLIDVGLVVPCTGDVNLLSLTALDSLDALHNSVVADVEGVLSNGAYQQSAGSAAVLDPVVLVGAAVEASEQDVLVGSSIVLNFGVNFVDNAFVGHVDGLCAPLVQSGQSQLVLTSVVLLFLQVDVQGDAVSLSQSLDLGLEAASAVQTGSGRVVLDDADLVAVDQNALSLQVSVEVLSNQFASLLVVGSDQADGGVLTLGDVSAVGVQAGVELDNGDLLVESGGQLIDEAGADGSQNDGLNIGVVQSGLNHVTMVGNFGLGLGSGALEGDLVATRGTSSLSAGLNSLPESVSLALGDNSDGLLAFLSGGAGHQAGNHDQDQQNCDQFLH